MPLKKMIPQWPGWIRPEPAIPRRQRQMNWLKKANHTQEQYDHFTTGITIQRIGGVFYNKDLRELVDRGLLKMVRIPYSKGWGGNYDLKKTVLVITEKGQRAVDRGSILE